MGKRATRAFEKTIQILNTLPGSISKFPTVLKTDQASNLLLSREQLKSSKGHCCGLKARLCQEKWGSKKLPLLAPRASGASTRDASFMQDHHHAGAFKHLHRHFLLPLQLAKNVGMSHP